MSFKGIPHLATPIPFGTEFLVGTTTTSTQNEPMITGLADGRFVVVWTDYSATGADTSGSAVRAQVFGADGTPVGAEFLVNTTTTFSQVIPTITTLAGGRFVVAWADQSATGGDTASYAVRAQMFNANGTAFGAEILVNTTVAAYQDQPTICGLANGRFVVAWRDGSQTGGDTSGSAIRAQVYSANGSALGGEFLVNTSTNSVQTIPAITALANGNFVITWDDFSQSGGDTSFNAIRAQVFSDTGAAVGAEFLVNTTVSSFQESPTTCGLADGRFVIAWSDNSHTGNDASGQCIRAQVFNADGSLSGSEFLVNTSVLGNQFSATITALADGRFAVAWVDNGAAFVPDIRGQIFDPREAAVTLNGTAVADDFVGSLYGDTMSGAAGDDAISGGAGNDQVFGQQGRDTLTGGSENDLLAGGGSNDQLSGGSGKDTLNGGAGVDRLTGGSGADVFVFSSAADAGTLTAHDKIKDFQAGSDDLNLSVLQSGQVFIGAAGFSNVAGQVRYDAATGLLGGDLTGDGVADYVIELLNKPALTAADLDL